MVMGGGGGGGGYILRLDSLLLNFAMSCVAAPQKAV